MKKKYYKFKLNLTILNIFSIILIFMVVMPTFILFYNHDINYFLLFIGYVAILIVHELLHCLGYRIYGAKKENIVFGILLEKSVAYCLCKQNVSKKNVLNSIMFPLFYIGIVTYVLGIVLKIPVLTLLSSFNIAGCSGDILMFLFIIKLRKNIQYTEMDDAISFAIYADEDVSKYKHFGLTYLGRSNSVERTDFRKFVITKWSIIILIILLFLALTMI